MNRDEAKKLAPIIQKFADGGDVQWRRSEDSPWQTYAEKDSSVVFAGGGDYRIKPVLFECWVNVYDTGSHIAWDSEEEALGVVEKYGEVVRTVHMREVE